MSDKKALPTGQQPTPAFVPSAPSYAGQYAPMYAQQQQQQQAALYQAAPPSYEQAMAHPSLTATSQAAAQHANAAWMYPAGQAAVYQNYQAAAAAAVAAQNFQQLQAAGYAYAPAYYPMSYPAYATPQPRQTIMVPAGFDGGARFDGVSQPSVPAAPPGVAPNAAQMAAMAGHSVIVGQKKGNFLTGSSEGGFTFW